MNIIIFIFYNSLVCNWLHTLCLLCRHCYLPDSVPPPPLSPLIPQQSIISDIITNKKDTNDTLPNPIPIPTKTQKIGVLRPPIKQNIIEKQAQPHPKMSPKAVDRCIIKL